MILVEELDWLWILWATTMIFFPSLGVKAAKPGSFNLGERQPRSQGLDCLWRWPGDEVVLISKWRQGWKFLIRSSSIIFGVL